MGYQIAIVGSDRPDELIADLCAVWERSVRATHFFLTEVDIVSMRPEVEAGLRGVQHLAVALDDDSGRLLGFAGAQFGRLEMLFIDDSARGMGCGKALLDFVVSTWDVFKVEVNEQNVQALGFYEHEGFYRVTRCCLDTEGRPFPLVYMQRKS